MCKNEACASLFKFKMHLLNMRGTLKIKRMYIFKCRLDHILIIIMASINIDEEEHVLHLGRSFDTQPDSAYHSFRCEYCIVCDYSSIDIIVKILL